ncbi:cation transport protein ChaC [Rubrimonas cliftonensis]|uniref:glutathione-specific gamma-glutamylcyclotransferase n=2 Tax=Rubrimonas cliftonensis TaxID=89524 RepID=A0A1H3Z8R8_9RHOB|nr:cation transport protein ChaC [Rubrimonas cliftonensis]
MTMENDARRATPSPEGDLWVFGYGSLIWRPGFDFAERRLARLTGWRRSFCLLSVKYRGTPEAPGLVLGLDEAPDGWCDGVAYRAPAAARDAVLAYLRERELITYAYREIFAPMRLEDGRAAVAVTYVVDRGHAQYAGALAEDAQARVIAAAAGPMGPNSEYLANTVAHLAQLGLSDPELDRLHARVSRLLGV